MRKSMMLMVTIILGGSMVIAQEMNERAIQDSYAIRTAYHQIEIEKREKDGENITNSSFAHTIILIPNHIIEIVVPLSGITTVSDGMFGLAVRSGARNRIVNSRSNKLKSCLIFSCDYELKRGKILNITDDEIVVYATYYYSGFSETEEIEVLPRTFSRLIANEGVQKIVCAFDN